MKSSRIKINIYILGLVLLAITSCTKDALDQKSDQRLVVASTITDFQQLLDGIGSYSTNISSHNLLGEYMTDNVVLTDAQYASFNTSNSQVVQKIYTWNKQLFSSSPTVTEWDDHYKTILVANVTLDGLKTITVNPSNQLAWNNVQGSALMIRGLMFLNVASYWSQPYKSTFAGTDLGIPLKLSSVVGEKIVRSTVSATYAQIISDLKGAAHYLPNTSAANSIQSKVRPSKAAAYGLLARAYLTMQDYASVKLYADSALELYSTLMDYNHVSYSFQDYNAEIVFDAIDGSSTGSGYYLYNLNPTLAQSFAGNDLRSTLFLQTYNLPQYNWGGDYSQYKGFTGLANDEIYLMRAEANARLGNTDAAMTDLNSLLVMRWKTGTYTAMTASSATDALNKILVERRKELIMRGTRWMDLRRLNIDPNYAVNQSRTVAGQTYTLPANDSRYTLQIPPYIIAFNGIQQNP